MKKTIPLIITIYLSILIAFGCNHVSNEAETDSKKENQVTQNEETATENKTEDENITETENNEENTGIIDLKNIKKGDKIEGLTVKKVDYRPGDYFSIKLEGEFSTKGNLQYNEFEDAFSFIVENNMIPQTKILVEGNEYDFYKTLNFSNRNEVKNALNEEQLKKFNSGHPVPLNIVVDNLLVGIKMNKGQLGVGWVDFVKIK